MAPLADNLVQFIPLTLIILGAVIWMSRRKSKQSNVMPLSGVQAANTGAPTSASPPLEKFCFQCGEKIHGLAEICPKCGLRQPQLPGMAIAVVQGPSRVAAGLFALFLGGIGIHKFYLGRVGWGVVYLLFCWTLIPAIVALVEGIIYLSMTDRDFSARYAR
jgi:hypothetical protein